MLHRISLLAALLAVALAAAAAPASADVTVKGTGEPAFTSSANNTQWVEWTSSSNYKIEFHHHVDGGAAVVNGPYQVARTGSAWVNWTNVRGVSTPLQEGSTYRICGFGRWDDGTGMYFPDFSTSCADGDLRGVRSATTIDRTKPTVAVSLAGGAATVRSASIPAAVAFTDNLAGPFPANFVCVQYGTKPDGSVCDSAKGYRYIERPACSQPQTNGRTTNSFACTVDVGGAEDPAPDGEVHVCVIAADAAIPDNPTSPDQRRPSSSANQSDAHCDSVLLDREAPSLAIDATPAAAVHAGEPVALGVQAADATSGLTGEYAWSFGDGDTAVGPAPTHAFEQPGTYEVTARTTDKAGNEAVAKRTIEVKARPAGDGTNGGGTPGTPGSPGTPAPVVPPTPTGGPVESGGGNPTPAPTLKLSTARKRTLAQARRGVRVTLTATAAGTARLALVTRGKLVAQSTKQLVAAGSVAAKLRFARKLKAGVYTVQATFTPVRGAASTVASKLTVGKARRARARARSASAAPPAVVATSDPTLPDGRFHGTAPRRFAPRAG